MKSTKYGAVVDEEKDMSMRMDASTAKLVGGGKGSCWGRRTSCEKTLIIFLGLVSVTAIGLVISTAVLKNENSDLNKRIGELDGLKTAIPPTARPSAEVCMTPECLRTAATVKEGMELKADPCDNFFDFACGNWVKMHPIPEDKGRFSNFDLLAEKVTMEHIEILGSGEDEDDIIPVLKAKTMYRSCIDEETVFRVTHVRVKHELESFGGWPIAMAPGTWNDSRFNWIEVEAAFKRFPPTPYSALSSLIDVSVTFDAKDTSRNIIYLDQPKLGLSRSFLVKPENYTKQINAYKSLMINVARFFADPTVADSSIEADVEAMLNFETSIANNSLPEEKRRQMDALYNKMSLTALSENLTNKTVNWMQLLNTIFDNIEEINESEPVIVVDIEYVKQLPDLYNGTDKRTIANYMLWRYVLSLLPHISRETQRFSQNFTMTIYGTKKPLDRAKVCTSEVDSGLGMALGRMYVSKNFKDSSKNKTMNLIQEIKTSFGQMLRDVTWMEPNTTAKAVEKASTMSTANIGYPDWILDDDIITDYYETVDITDSNHAGNLWSAANYSSYLDLATLREYPADKTKWYMTPGTVNAYYVPELNSINFPAGILQLPFFQASRMKALNFGAIGAVIGHEITHGFDDQGRQYDQDGNLDKWWPDNVIDNFQERASCYVEQYGNFCPPELNQDGQSVCLNGNNTLGENIADNGGLKAAYIAYQNWVKKNGREKFLPGLEKYTPEQLFFIGFAQLWCVNTRPESLLNTVLKDPHSPPKYRIIGTLANSQFFSEAYNCEPKKGSERCELW